MADDSTAERIRKELVRDTDDILVDNLETAKQLFHLDEGTGNVLLTKTSQDFGPQDRILVELIGQLYAEMAGLVDESSLETSDIANRIGKDSNVVSARLSDLRDKGWVKSPSRGVHKFNEHRLEEVLDHLNQ